MAGSKSKKYELDNSENEMLKINIDLLIKNYSFFEDRIKIYFENLYNIMNFTIIFYAGVFVLLNAFSGYNSDVQRITFSLIVFYAVPVITYILGLFYNYNSLQLYRLGEEEISIEKEMKELTKRVHIDFAFSEWGQKVKNQKLFPGFVLPYGTLLIFYILVPIAVMSVFNVFITWPKDMFFWLIQVIVPAILWLVYIVFMLILIYNMIKAQKRISNKA